MKKQKTVSPATAPAVESAPAPQVSETTAQRDPANRKVSIPPELTKPNERRAFALAYRRTLDGQKLDFMPGALIPALCKGIAAAVFHAERIARETGIRIVGPNTMGVFSAYPSPVQSVMMSTAIKQGEVGDAASDFMLGEGVTEDEVNAALSAFVAAQLEGTAGPG